MGSLIEKFMNDPDLKCAAGLALTPLLGPVAPALACQEAVKEKLAPKTEPCDPSIPPERCEAGRKFGQELEKNFRIFKRFHHQIPGFRCRVERSVRDLSLSILGLSAFAPIAVGLERFGYPQSCHQDSAQLLKDAGKLAAEVAISSAALGIGAYAARSLGRSLAKAASKNIHPQVLEKAVEQLRSPVEMFFFHSLF